MRKKGLALTFGFLIISLILVAAGIWGVTHPPKMAFDWNFVSISENGKYVVTQFGYGPSTSYRRILTFFNGETEKPLWEYETLGYYANYSEFYPTYSKPFVSVSLEGEYIVATLVYREYGYLDVLGLFLKSSPSPLWTSDPVSIISVTNSCLLYTSPSPRD